jgi:hypothetical protein
MTHRAHRPVPAKRIFASLSQPPTLCPNCEEPDCDCSDEDKEIAAMASCAGVRSRKTGRHERCAWVERSDWMGDPSIPHGTVSWEYAECLACGAEVQRPYPQWLENALPQPEDSY